MSEVSEAAKVKAEELEADWHHHPVPSRVALQRFIQDVSDVAKAQDAQLAGLGIPAAAPVRQHVKPFILPDLVDPLLIEAREIAASASSPLVMEEYRSGRQDHSDFVRVTLAALKRGMELASEGVRHNV